MGYLDQKLEKRQQRVSRTCSTYNPWHTLSSFYSYVWVKILYCFFKSLFGFIHLSVDHVMSD